MAKVVGFKPNLQALSTVEKNVIKFFVVFFMFMYCNHIAIDINKNKLNKKIDSDETIIIPLKFNFIFINIVASFVIILGIEYLLSDIKIDFSNIDYILYFQLFNFLLVTIALTVFIIVIFKANSKSIFITNKFVRFMNLFGNNKLNSKHPMNDSLFLCNEDIKLKDIKNISIKKDLFGNVLKIEFLDNTSKFLMYLKPNQDLENILNKLIGENKCRKQKY